MRQMLPFLQRRRNWKRQGKQDKVELGHRCVRTHREDSTPRPIAGRMDSWDGKAWLLWVAGVTMLHSSLQSAVTGIPHCTFCRPNVHTWATLRLTRHDHYTDASIQHWETFQSKPSHISNSPPQNDFRWFILKKETPLFLSIVGVQQHTPNEQCGDILIHVL